MSEELARRDDDLPERQPRREIVFNPEQTEEVINDIETMLNLIKGYQRMLQMLYSPDPQVVTARRILNKYHMEALKTHPMYKILLDGRDITDFPDSLPGSAVEDFLELDEGDDD